MSAKPNLLQRYQSHLLVALFLVLFLGALGIERAALRKETVSVLVAPKEYPRRLRHDGDL